MKIWGTGSLRGQITRAMIWMQVFVLIAFTSVAAIPIVKLAGVDQGRLDETIIDDAAASIGRTPDGGLEMAPTAQLNSTIKAFPNIWIYAVDSVGTSASLGNVPSHILPVLTDLTLLESASIANTGDPVAPDAIMRRHESTFGPLWIVAAGGPEMGLVSVGRALSNSIFLLLVAVLTLASFVVLPIVIDRQFRGVEDIAAQVGLVDVDQRSMRLSSKKLPDEIRPLVEAFNAALQRLDDGIVRQQRFLADAAHELRTPIAILQTRVELLQGGPDRTRLLLDLVRLANLANQLLDLQRLAESSLKLEHLDIVRLAADITADMAPLVIAAGAEISFDTQLPHMLATGDAGSLTRALTNLIQNAIVHGGKAIAVTVTAGDAVILSVLDNGSGVPREYRDTIFEPFHRLLPMEQGAGLGLHLVKDIVLKHGGSIGVTDNPDGSGGACFKIRLPLPSTSSSRKSLPTSRS